MPKLRLTLLVLTLAAAFPSAASARDTVVTSFDGTKLVTHFFPAAGLGHGKKAPTVMVGHGYGGKGDTDPESRSTLGGPGLGALRAAGYNVLTWDARGFGASGGLVEVDSPKFEGRDAQALISYVARQPEALLDKPGDPRVGMAGGSYGGGIQLVTAGIDKRVDAITPVIAWNDLRTSLFKQRTVKLGWSTLLSAGGGPHQDPLILRGAREGATTGTISPTVENFFKTRGLPGLVDRVRVPTLLVQGTSDTLFTLDEASRSYQTLRSNGVPVRMVWFCGGHAPCTTAPGPKGLVASSVLAWFRRYLKPGGKGGVGAPFTYVAQDGKARDGVTFPPRPTGALKATGAGTLPLAPGTGSGTLTIAKPSTDGFSLDVPRAKDPFNVAGSPKLTLTYSGTGNRARTWVYARIVDPVRNVVLGNIDQPVPVTLDGRAHTVSLPIEAIAYHGNPGARLRLQVAAASSLYAPQRATGSVTLRKVGIDVPTVNLRGLPPLRLTVRDPRRFVGARPGHPATVKVRAAGDILSGVKVIVRDAHGRRVGSSKTVTVSSKARTVRVRVNRRIGVGRYRMTAVGTSPERLRATGVFTLTIVKR